MMKHRAFGEAPQVPIQAAAVLAIGADGIATLGGVPIGGAANGRAKFKFFTIVCSSGPVSGVAVPAFPLSGSPGSYNIGGAATGAEFHGLSSFTSAGGEAIAFLFT